MDNINISLNIPDSGITITERVYPISTMWIFKWPIIIIVISFVAILFGYYFPYLLILLPFYLISNPFTKSKFHYSVNAESLWVKQGLFSKIENTLPYNNIKNVFVKRDIFDKIFGLGNLYINSSIPEPVDSKSVFSNMFGVNKNANLSKNDVSFIGLRARDAEILKVILLKKMEFSKNGGKNTVL